jgi:hypothetical protein
MQLGGNSVLCLPSLARGGGGGVCCSSSHSFWGNTMPQQCLGPCMAWLCVHTPYLYGAFYFASASRLALLLQGCSD